MLGDEAALGPLRSHLSGPLPELWKQKLFRARSEQRSHSHRSGEQSAPRSPVSEPAPMIPKWMIGPVTSTLSKLACQPTTAAVLRTLSFPVLHSELSSHHRRAESLNVAFGVIQLLNSSTLQSTMSAPVGPAKIGGLPVQKYPMYPVLFGPNVVQGKLLRLPVASKRVRREGIWFGRWLRRRSCGMVVLFAFICGPGDPYLDPDEEDHQLTTPLSTVYGSGCSREFALALFFRFWVENFDDNPSRVDSTELEAALLRNGTPVDLQQMSPVGTCEAVMGEESLDVHASSSDASKFVDDGEFISDGKTEVYPSAESRLFNSMQPSDKEAVMSLGSDVQLIGRADPKELPIGTSPTTVRIYVADQSYSEGKRLLVATRNIFRWPQNVGGELHAFASLITAIIAVEPKDTTPSGKIKLRAADDGAKAFSRCAVWYISGAPGTSSSFDLHSLAGRVVWEKLGKSPWYENTLSPQKDAARFVYRAYVSAGQKEAAKSLRPVFAKIMNMDEDQQCAAAVRLFGAVKNRSASLRSHSPELIPSSPPVTVASSTPVLSASQPQSEPPSRPLAMPSAGPRNQSKIIPSEASSRMSRPTPEPRSPALVASSPKVDLIQQPVSKPRSILRGTPSFGQAFVANQNSLVEKSALERAPSPHSPTSIFFSPSVTSTWRPPSKPRSRPPSAASSGLANPAKKITLSRETRECDARVTEARLLFRRRTSIIGNPSGNFFSAAPLQGAITNSISSGKKLPAVREGFGANSRIGGSLKLFSETLILNHRLVYLAEPAPPPPSPTPTAMSPAATSTWQPTLKPRSRPPATASSVLAIPAKKITLSRETRERNGRLEDGVFFCCTVAGGNYETHFVWVLGAEPAPPRRSPPRVAMSPAAPSTWQPTSKTRSYPSSIASSELANPAQKMPAPLQGATTSSISSGKQSCDCCQSLKDKWYEDVQAEISTLTKRVAELSMSPTATDFVPSQRTTTTTGTELVLDPEEEDQGMDDFSGDEGLVVSRRDSADPWSAAPAPTAEEAEHDPSQRATTNESSSPRRVQLENDNLRAKLSAATHDISRMESELARLVNALEALILSQSPSSSPLPWAAEETTPVAQLAALVSSLGSEVVAHREQRERRARATEEELRSAREAVWGSKIALLREVNRAPVAVVTDVVMEGDGEGEVEVKEDTAALDARKYEVGVGRG
ncbi:hypothetical protein BDK51DRAFT_30272 [Blyttiomyces helicus]|uniref:Uncharacterized protein n=1 Tax=Blyttiomyces helicus TaxID=388810 RepID=A0A4P9WN49_9FUNG|nr:hypothetical protein BDK51DRAFT_30272 [Blyttiomyces helicus]|eukprot:RKO94354.1 hypothetical protein BDK51DRAFT_30272 [Blyttiomyces helicus]